MGRDGIAEQFEESLWSVGRPRIILALAKDGGPDPVWAAEGGRFEALDANRSLRVLGHLHFVMVKVDFLIYV